MTTVGTTGIILSVKRSRRAPIISVSPISGITDDAVLCLGSVHAQPPSHPSGWFIL